MAKTTFDEDAACGELIELGAATAGEAGGQPMDPRIRPIWSGARLCAPLFTARCVSGDNLAIHAAVARAPRGSALAVSVGEIGDFGYWGEVLTTAAEARGIKGLVIAGGVRDASALEAHGFPVFATMIALRGAAKVAGGELGREVEIGGVSVRSGDWAVGDADGVTLVRQEKLTEVLAASRARAQKESRLFAELRGGRTTVELLDLDTSTVSGID
jgi:4-hydroxy-4-methyl-2-oxoglutarate aldolase